MKRICVIGSLNMDLVINTPRVPAMGETIHGHGFFTAPGGKGANQAVAASRLGGDVMMIGCLGEDIFGKTLLDNLAANGVDTSHIAKVSGVPTGIAVITVCGGDNCIILNSGANYSITNEQIESLENVIKESKILLLQLEIPLEVVEKSVDIARKKGVRVLLNPAPAVKLTDELLGKIDILTPNESECEILTGLPVKTVEDAGKAITYLLNKGVRQVVVTMGGKGVVYNSSDKIVHKPVPKVQVVDTTAAGDSFTGALSVALTSGKDMDEAVDFANAVGTLTVTRKGAQTSLPTLDEVENYMTKGVIPWME